jgi:antitoxin ParD1/3/4
MTVALKPEHEQIIQEQLASGRFHSVEELLDTAFSRLREEGDQTGSFDEAVRHMVDFAENRSVKLPPGEKVKDLIDEGRRY